MVVRFLDTVEQHVTFQPLSTGHAIIPIHETSRTIVEDVVADRVLTGDRLEIGSRLLDPNTDGIDVIPLDEVPAWIVSVLRVVDHPSSTGAHDQDRRVANLVEIVLRNGAIAREATKEYPIAVDLVEAVAGDCHRLGTVSKDTRTTMDRPVSSWQSGSEPSRSLGLDISRSLHGLRHWCARSLQLLVAYLMEFRTAPCRCRQCAQQ
jgi:hypothetical protein